MVKLTALAANSIPLGKGVVYHNVSHSDTGSCLNRFWGNNELEAHWMKYGGERLYIEPVKWMKYMKCIAHLKGGRDEGGCHNLQLSNRYGRGIYKGISYMSSCLAARQIPYVMCGSGWLINTMDAQQAKALA